MVIQLTNKQKKTLQVIESFIITHGVPPTLSEMQVLLDVSSNQAVLNHLDALEQKGFIVRKKTARGIRLVKQTRSETENVDFVDLLTGLAEKKRQRTKNIQKIGYSDPYSADETSGKVLVGYFNNERY